jgi:hypothetical protein
MKSPLFSGALHLRLEPELRDSIAAVARREKPTSAKWIRRELRERVAVRSAPSDDDGPGPFSPGAGMRQAA